MSIDKFSSPPPFDFNNVSSAYAHAMPREYEIIEQEYLQERVIIYKHFFFLYREPTKVIYIYIHITTKYNAEIAGDPRQNEPLRPRPHPPPESLK